MTTAMIPRTQPVDTILTASTASRIPSVAWMPRTTLFGVIFASRPMIPVAAKRTQTIPIAKPEA